MGDANPDSEYGGGPILCNGIGTTAMEGAGMGSLMLVGATGLAREVLAVECANGRYDDAVIVDDRRTLWGAVIHGAKVIGPLAAAAPATRGDLVLCAEDAVERRETAERLFALGVTPDRWATVVHPAIDVPPTCTVGAGSILLAGAVLTADVQLHRHVVVMANAVLAHDVLVWDNAVIGAGAALAGAVRVGEAATVGMNASVRCGVHVGAESTLGMGSVLLEDLPIGETWAGVPATALRRGARRPLPLNRSVRLPATRASAS